MSVIESPIVQVSDKKGKKKIKKKKFKKESKQQQQQQPKATQKEAGVVADQAFLEETFGFKARTSSPPVSCILPDFLYLGSAYDSHDVVWMKENSVTGILCVAKELDFQEMYDSKTKYKKLDIDDEDTHPIRKTFDVAIAFLEKAREDGVKVLVHCMAGMSRSATIVIAYLMIKRKMRLLEAVSHVKKIRPTIYPNQGFMKTLVTLDEDLYGKPASVSYEDILKYGKY